MSTKRRRTSGAWEFKIQNQKVLGKGVEVYFTFDDEQEGDLVCKNLENIMRTTGTIPPKVAALLADRKRGAGGASVGKRTGLITIGDAIDRYCDTVTVKLSEKKNLTAVKNKIGETPLADACISTWPNEWVKNLKRTDRKPLSPTTITHQVGALSRCFNWLVKTHPEIMTVNTLKSLDRNFAAYSAEDIRQLPTGTAVPIPNKRDRRLEKGEEDAIRLILSGDSKHPPLAIENRAALLAMFDLALETCMRLREIYTLTANQADTEKRTFFLTKTKNGDDRQVPMTSVALRVLQEYLAGRKLRGNDSLFPFWDSHRKFDTDEKRTEALNALTADLSRFYIRKIFVPAKCDDLHFHDLRHEAICRWFLRTKYDSTIIAKISGHKDPRMLARYANLRGSELYANAW